jgi:hypothetical protein
MPMRSFGGFDPEAIAEMTEALDAAFEELQDTGEPDVVRERIANRIIAAAKLGERDPARLLEAALQITSMKYRGGRQSAAAPIPAYPPR